MFLLWKGEVANRWDVFFNWALKNTNLNFKYPTETLESFTKSFSGGTPSKEVPEYWDGDILWASPKDMKHFHLTNTEDRITEQAVLVSSTKMVEKDTILIVVRSGILIHTLPVCMAKEKMAINQDLKAYTTKDHVLPEYLAVFLKIFEKKLLPLIVKHSTTVQSINTEQFDKLPIPIPPKDIQIQIIQKYSDAIKQRNEAVYEVQSLRASIDTYLLDALGIQLPPTPSVNLSERVFLARLGEIDGNRFDPFFHQEYYKKLDDNIENGHFKVEELGKFLCSIQYGASISNSYVEKGIPFLRIKDLQRNDISIDEVVYLDETVRDAIGSGFVYEDDFLISRSGTIGIVARVPKALNGFAFGSFMIKFRLSEEARGVLDEDYLGYFLNCGIVEKILLRQKIGAIQGNITIPTIRSILIPLPPLSIQQTISAHIGKIRREAGRLDAESAAAVDIAKAAIEALLLA